MTPENLVPHIESALYRSWLARECAEYDGWQLRYASGFSRRGNSVYPAAVSTLPVDEKIGYCRRWYAERGLGLVVRQTPATEPGLDTILEQEAFTREGETHVMVAATDRGSGAVAVSSAPSPDWWETTADLWGFDADAQRGWRRLIAGIEQPAGFVCLAGMAAGLGIVADRWLGIFEVVVADDRRRKGTGTALVDSLIGWGAGEGADHVYLQVLANNNSAIAFYERLGFRRAYTYWYRRDQLSAANGPS